MKMNNSADDLLFLLSTDWFVKARLLIGLKTPEPVLRKIKEACRGIVRSLLNGANYWEVEMSPPRLERTRLELLSTLKGGGLDADDRERLVRFVSEEETVAEAEDLLTNLLFLFASEAERAAPLAGISEHAVNLISSELSKLDSGEAIAALAWSEKSSWDEGMERVREGATAYLTLVAKRLAMAFSRDERMWQALVGTMSKAEVGKLTTWLNARALELVGREVVAEHEPSPPRV